jgi:hypothetical protein
MVGELGFASVSNVTMVREHRDVCRMQSPLHRKRVGHGREYRRLQLSIMRRRREYSIYTSETSVRKGLQSHNALVIEFRRCFPSAFHCLISAFYCSSVFSVLFSPKGFRVLGKIQVSEPGFLRR